MFKIFLQFIYYMTLHPATYLLGPQNSTHPGGPHNAGRLKQVKPVNRRLKQVKPVNPETDPTPSHPTQFFSPTLTYYIRTQSLFGVWNGINTTVSLQPIF